VDHGRRALRSGDVPLLRGDLLAREDGRRPRGRRSRRRRAAGLRPQPARRRGLQGGLPRGAGAEDGGLALRVTEEDGRARARQLRTPDRRRDVRAGRGERIAREIDLLLEMRLGQGVRRRSIDGVLSVGARGRMCPELLVRGRSAPRRRGVRAGSGGLDLHPVGHRALLQQGRHRRCRVRPTPRARRGLRAGEGGCRGVEVRGGRHGRPRGIRAATRRHHLRRRGEPDLLRPGPVTARASACSPPSPPRSPRTSGSRRPSDPRSRTRSDPA
jgi:hypothetical protein